jgi:Tfp pilus tip-associated adhesin PilY1
MDADTGTLLKSFSTTRSVVADVSMIDVNNDGYQDYAYVVDMGGNFYRISFVDTPSALTPLAAIDWSMKKVAYANEGGRKFMQTPALALGAGRSVYIALGSGDREHPLYTDYPYANVTNAAYVYLDQPDAYDAATTACDLDDDDAGEPGSCVVDYSSATTCNTDPLIPGAAFKAWRMHLEKQGEQTVTPALIFSGQVTFNTNRPIPPSQAACNVALGEGGGYLLDLLNASGAIGVEGTCNGSRRGTFVKGVGMPTAPVLVNIAGEAPIVIGAVNKMTGSDAALVAPQQPPLPIAKTRHRKYRYQQIDQ